MNILCELIPLKALGIGLFVDGLMKMEEQAIIAYKLFSLSQFP